MKKTITKAIPLFFSLAAFAASSNVWADGTTAGTDIDNTATINYSVGSVAQTAIESADGGNTTPGVGEGTATTFVVDKKVDLNVTADAGTNNVVPGATSQEVTFSVKNEGNSDETFAFSTATTTTTADQFDPSSCAAISNVAIAAGVTETITVSCDMPASLPGALVVNGNTATVDLIASVTSVSETAGGDTAGMDTVFADNAGTNTGDTNRDAKHSATSIYTVATAALTVNKTDAVTKMEINGSDISDGTEKRIPGATIEYTITVSNAAGMATATGIVITDPVPGDLTFVSASLTDGDANVTTPTESGGTVTSAAFDLDAGETATMTITATIN